jgi:hypothetical protein
VFAYACLFLSLRGCGRWSNRKPPCDYRVAQAARRLGRLRACTPLEDVA